jgi:heme-degrading monooxygenase HmoA
MHAVVVKVNINDEDAAERVLREEVVPQVSQAPGFVAGYWTRKDNTGLSMIVFESEDAAEQAAERVPSTVPEAVTLEGVEVREVAAHA